MSRRTVALLVAALLVTVSPAPGSDLPAAVGRLVERTSWLKSGHEYGSACIRIAGSKVIYIDSADPRQADAGPKADLILVTHSHPDHFSPEVLAQLRKPSTWIVTVADCAERLRDWPRVEALAPGQTTSIEGVTIQAVPAYNTASQAHPRSNGWAGFVLTIDGVRVYHSGDTSYVPEMAALEDVDVAFLDVRPPYQMSGREMVSAARAMKLRVAIPIHWLDAERGEVDYLSQHAPAGTKVVVLTAR